ncbi:unnamed protein product [Sphagnum compactum]
MSLVTKSKSWFSSCDFIFCGPNSSYPNRSAKGRDVVSGFWPRFPKGLDVVLTSFAVAPLTAREGKRASSRGDLFLGRKIVVETELAEELDDLLDDDYFWEDDFEPEPEVGDGGEGGGVVFGDSSWGPKALNLANDVLALFNGDLAIFAFKANEESDLIRLRLDKLSDKYGSPTIDEIQQFSSSYSKSLERSGEAGIIPKNLAFEVSSPGAERVVQIPQDLERFKELPMYVRYLETGIGEEAEEKDGVFELESVDTESKCSVWKLANVRINRESIGKGRGLNKKQREWRCQMPFESLQLVRLYIDL